MKTEFRMNATKSATYDRVVVEGRVLPLSSPASVAKGDTLTGTIATSYSISPSAEVIWLEKGEPLTADMIIDHHARELALRRPA